MTKSKVNTKALVYLSNVSQPFFCPPDNNSELSHPKVFIKFDKNSAMCPYCGTNYIIKNDKK